MLAVKSLVCRVCVHVIQSLSSISCLLTNTLLRCSLLHLQSKQSQQMQASRLHHSAPEGHVPPGGQVSWTGALSAALSHWQSSSRGSRVQVVSVLMLPVIMTKHAFTYSLYSFCSLQPAFD